MTKSLTLPETPRKILLYENGTLYWRERSVDLFSDGKYPAQRRANVWNSRHAGREAFTYLRIDGYRQGSIFDRLYLAHRVIWAMVHGEWPSDQIDHINGIRDDNRIENLRSVTNQENMQNAKRPRDNTSGVIGVVWHKPASKWVAQIQVDGCGKYLGCFVDKADAIAARKAAEVEHNFSPNHGRC